MNPESRSCWRSAGCVSVQVRMFIIKKDLTIVQGSSQETGILLLGEVLYLGDSIPYWRRVS